MRKFLHHTGWMKAGAGPLGALLLSVSNVSALPLISAPFPTDEAVPFLTSASAWDVNTASDGQNLLTVFEDSGSIRGMLLGPEGQPLVPSMLRLDPVAPEEFYTTPDVAFGAGGYLVVWARQSGVEAQFIAADGGRQGEALNLDADGMYPVVAWNGTAFNIVWMDFTTAGRDLVSVLVTPDGQVGQATQVTTTGDATEPRLAAGNNVALLAWYANPDTQSAGAYGLLLDAAGQVQDTTPMTLSGPGAYDLDVVSSGDGFLAAFRHSEGVEEIRAALVTSAGEVTADVTVASGGSYAAPCVGFDGSQYVVVWKAYNPANDATPDAYVLQHVDLAGQTDPAETQVTALWPSGSGLPSVLWTGERYWVTYDDSGLRGVFLDAAGQAVSEPVGVSMIAHPQGSPSSIWDGEHYVVVWADEREGPGVYSGHAVRVSTAGQVLDAPALPLSQAEHRANWVAVASSKRGSTLTAWSNTSREALFGRVVNSDGSLGQILALDGVASGGVQLTPNGDGYLALYSGAAPEGYGTWGQFLNADGEAASEVHVLRTQESSVVASVHTGHEGALLVYQDGGTFVATVAAEGVLGEPLAISTDGAMVQVAANDSQTLIVWGQYADNARYARLYAAGAWQGEALEIASDGLWGSTTWDGEQFVLVWEDETYRSSLRTLSAAGVLSPAERLFEEECTASSLASNGQGQALLSCIRYTENSRTRRIDNYLLGEPSGPVIELPVPSSTVPAPSVSVTATAPSATTSDAPQSPATAGSASALPESSPQASVAPSNTTVESEALGGGGAAGQAGGRDDAGPAQADAGTSLTAATEMPLVPAQDTGSKSNSSCAVVPMRSGSPYWLLLGAVAAGTILRRSQRPSRLAHARADTDPGL